MLFRGLCIAIAATLGCRGDTRPAAVAADSQRALFRDSVTAPCERPAANGTAPAANDTVVIANTTYPCRLFFRETGIVLRGDSAKGVPMPGEFVARDSKGRFFSNIVGDQSRIAVWNADGSFDRTMGQAGPGELALPRTQFAPVVHVDGDDRLYVRWGGGLWSVYEPTLQFLGRIPVPSPQTRHANAVFRGGFIMASTGTRGDQLEYFRRYGVGGPTPAFATIPLAIRHGTSFRGIVAADDTTFWAGPDPADDDGYSLERWTIGGERIMGFRREVPWFPEMGISSETRDPAEPPRPTVNPMNVDAEGLVLVYTLIPNDAWRQRPAGEAPPAVAADRNVHIEVIDPRAATALASEVVNISTYTSRTIPYEFFPRTRLGYVQSRTDGRAEVRVVEYGLARR